MGNPPFIGGSKISGVLGSKYRGYLVEYLARECRGLADYVAYFFLRAEELLKGHGVAGLIATKSVAQGDSREVGLEQIVARGATIYRCIASRKWPGEANLHVAHVWFRKGGWSGKILLEGEVVHNITSGLTPAAELLGEPKKLIENVGVSFEGSKLRGTGFLLNLDDGRDLLERHPFHRDVVLPYIGGKDITDRWDLSPSRWVINFRNWPIERAQQYPQCLAILERSVKPEREGKSEGSLRTLWWQFERPRAELYAAIADLERVLVGVRVSAHHTMAFAPSNLTYSDRLVVFALSRGAHLALLTSSIHDAWAHRPGSMTHETRNTYFPERSFETFPFPSSIDAIESLGERYHSDRRSIMADRREGLTMTYNRFHSPHEVSHDIASLRAMHVEMDHAVAAAYGWTDLDLDHGFHQTKQGMRYTISEAARRTVLDRLLALNHERHAQEVAASPLSKPKRQSKKPASGVDAPTLF